MRIMEDSQPMAATMIARMAAGIVIAVQTLGSSKPQGAMVPSITRIAMQLEGLE